MLAYVLAALAGAALAIGLGFLLGRAVGAARVARAEADARAARQAEHHATSELERARASLAVRLAEVERRSAELARLRAEWDDARATTDAEFTEQRARQGRLRQKLDARAEKLARRARRQQERGQALTAAAEALEALEAEARERQREAEDLRAHVQTLARQAGRRQQEAAERQQELEAWQARLEKEQARADVAAEEARRKLEAVAGLSRRDARRALSDEMHAEAKLEAAAHVKEIRDEAKMTANREARKVILTAIQRLAASTTIENTVSVVPLASDEMKGRVIGREGRNIRAFEAATGIEVIVDDTPEAVLLSGFDPVRREVARLSMAQLVQDGRIHPARIEDVVEKTRAEVEEEVVEAGERAVIDLGIHGLHPELVRMVGRMKFRTSYGQNLLAHSVEVARLASLMAAELDLDPKKARRAGLLHDIGKVSEEEIEQPHALVGMEWAQRFKEHPEVCNAIGAHHDEIEMTTPIAPLVQAADAISGARPGARREALQNYVQRLEHLEALASGFDGVERVFAMQAGRELRVIVNHTLVSDAQAESMARDVARRIEAEMQYPGQVKVTVIREVRASALAR